MRKKLSEKYIEELKKRLILGKEYVKDNYDNIGVICSFYNVIVDTLLLCASMDNLIADVSDAPLTRKTTVFHNNNLYLNISHAQLALHCKAPAYVINNAIKKCVKHGVIEAVTVKGNRHKLIRPLDVDEIKSIKKIVDDYLKATGGMKNCD